MSVYYGKAVFKDNTEAFFVYWTSPGWATRPLFSTLEGARDWKNAGYPKLEREEDEAIEISKMAEEPVHVLIDVDSPEKASMWFYTTASKTGMVITGPKSGLEAEESNEIAGGIYSKAFYDAWECEKPAAKKPASRKVIPADDGMQP
jgi:hypothetical protein